MKTLIITAALFMAGLFSICQAQNPVENTAWEGEVQLGDNLSKVILRYGPDTVRMYLAQTSELLETMTYKVEGDMFTWIKVSGGSPCDTTTPGTWQFEIKEDEMSLKPLNEPCPGRADAWIYRPFKKVAFE